MQRCINLAQKGLGNVAPNPLVGCVIVNENEIIGEGYHVKFGELHAEIKALESVEDKSLLSSSTLYVNLEPCNHHGKTPLPPDGSPRHGRHGRPAVSGRHGAGTPTVGQDRGRRRGGSDPSGVHRDVPRLCRQQRLGRIPEHVGARMVATASWKAST